MKKVQIVQTGMSRYEVRYGGQKIKSFSERDLAEVYCLDSLLGDLSAMGLYSAGAKRDKKIIHLETGKVYRSASEASKVLGLHRGNVVRSANGVRNSTGGQHFKWYEA